MDTEGPVIVLTTTPRGTGEVLAQALILEGHAACVNLIGATSLFRWEGALCREAEDLIVIKTEGEKVPALMKRVRELHSYQVPEMVVIPIAAGYEPYLQWLHQEVNR